MRERVEGVLKEVNRRFYRDHAVAFDATRGRPWPGWSRVRDVVRGSGPQSILDVGCGNGRLVEAFGGEFESLDYTGLDASPGLLAAARARLRGRRDLSFRCVAWDALAGALPRSRSNGYSLVALFGFSHHVPGTVSLCRLLELAFDQVGPGGHLAVSFWQFAELEKFRGKALPAASVGLEDSDLDRSDYLLPWQRATGAVRYCHYVSPEEAQRLVALLPGTVVDRFRSDGATGELNLYYVVRREPSGSNRE